MNQQAFNFDGEGRGVNVNDCDRQRVAGREVNDVGHSPALARRSDPPTSAAAAAEQDASGRTASHADTVFAVVKRWPGLTYREIWQRLGGSLEPAEVNRRLDGLRAEHRVFTGHEDRRHVRKCSVSGRLAQTWWRPLPGQYICYQIGTGTFLVKWKPLEEKTK